MKHFDHKIAGLPDPNDPAHKCPGPKYPAISGISLIRADRFAAPRRPSIMPRAINEAHLELVRMLNLGRLPNPKVAGFGA
jgi:hypothetical protein